MSSSAQLANAVQGARAVAAQGDVRGAFALLDQALDAASTTLVADDPDVLSATCLLAKFHADLGELADARRVLEEGLAAGYHRLGDGHAVMLGLSYELARIADELGNVYEAKRRYGQLAKLGPQALGEDHPSVRAARRYLRLPEPATTVHVPHSTAPATFDPLSPPTSVAPPPQHTWPVDEQSVDDRPIFRPEPRDEPAPTVVDFDQDEEEDQEEDQEQNQEGDREEDEYEPDTGRDDEPGAWQQSEHGVLQRTDLAPASAHPWPEAQATEIPWPNAQASGPPWPETQASGPPWPQTQASGPPWPETQASGPPWPTSPAADARGWPEREADAWSTAPAVPPLPPSTSVAPPRRRSPLVALLAILIVAILGGITAAVVSFVAARPDASAQPQQPAQTDPSTGAASAASSTPTTTQGAVGNPKAPASLRLRDDRTAITLTWVDPSKGTVSFIVAGGQQGALRQLQVLAAGSTTYTINGLNPKLDYCFTVAAVYSTNSVELSDLACTKRT